MGPMLTLITGLPWGCSIPENMLHPLHFFDRKLICRQIIFRLVVSSTTIPTTPNQFSNKKVRGWSIFLGMDHQHPLY